MCRVGGSLSLSGNSATHSLVAERQLYTRYTLSIHGVVGRVGGLRRTQVCLAALHLSHLDLLVFKPLSGLLWRSVLTFQAAGAPRAPFRVLGLRVLGGTSGLLARGGRELCLR